VCFVMCMCMFVCRFVLVCGCVCMCALCVCDCKHGKIGVVGRELYQCGMYGEEEGK
jgi:hypothetical protein